MPIGLRWFAIILGLATTLCSPVSLVIILLAPLAILLPLGALFLTANVQTQTKLFIGVALGAGVLAPAFMSVVQSGSPNQLSGLLPGGLLSAVVITARGLKSSHPLFSWWSPSACFGLSVFQIWFLLKWLDHPSIF